MNPDTCGRANSIWIRTRLDVEIFESSKKNLPIQKYPDTSLRGLKVRSDCHFDKVWERHSWDNACFFLLFSRYLRRHCGCSSFLVALPCKTAIDMRRFRWKADDLMGKGRRKRGPRLLANKEARIWKQLNVFSWMLAAILTKYCGSFAFKNPPSELELCV